MTNITYRIRHKPSGKFLTRVQELVPEESRYRYRLTTCAYPTDIPWEGKELEGLNEAKKFSTSRNLDWHRGPIEAPIQPYDPSTLEIVQLVTTESVVDLW